MKKFTEKLITLLLIGVVFMSSISFEVQAAGSSSMSVSSSSVNIGDTVSATLSISVESGHVTNLQMAISYDKNILEYQGSDDTSCNGGGGALVFMRDLSAGHSFTMTFKAIAPGTATISASTTAAYIEETLEETTVSGSSATVTVNNAASSGGGTGGTGSPGGSTGGGETSGGETQEPQKSADNSLKSLTISPGTLSPTFKGSTTKYTASVSEDVTSIAVDAQVSNSKATVESVTGNTDLQMGENIIRIVVKAENGTTATYTITVTRGGAAEEPSDEPEEPTEPSDEPENTGILIDGVSYQVSETLPEEEFPEEFVRGTVTYDGKTVEAYTFPYKDMTLFYLIPTTAGEEDPDEETGNIEGGKFYFYNETDDQFFPYINIAVGDTYVLVLPASFAEEDIPAGYQETAVSVREFTVSGYQLLAGGEDTASDESDTSAPEDMTDPENTADPEDTTEPDGTTVGAASKEANTRTIVSTGLGETDSDEDSAGTDGANADTVETDSTDTDGTGVDTAQAEDITATEPAEFYLLYGVNRDGVAGWYQYDTTDVSLQRYHETSHTADEDSQVNVDALNKAYTDLENRYREEKSTSRLIMAVLIFLLVVAIFAIINILLFAVKGKGSGKHKKGDGDIDYIDLDDL